MKLNTLPKPERSAKQFLLSVVPDLLRLFEVPQNILTFNTENIVRKQIYAMSEESAALKLAALKKMLEKW